MRHGARFIDDEHGPCQQWQRQAFEQHAPILAERMIVNVGQRVHGLDVLARAEPLLCERQIEAHGVTRHGVAEGRDAFFKLLGLDAARRRVERWHDAEQPRFRRGVAERDGSEAVVERLEVRCFLPRFDFGTSQRLRFALESNCIGA